MSIALSALRTRLNNILNDTTSIWSDTVKNQAINSGIARLYSYNFLEKQDTTQTTDTDDPTFLYTTPSDCEQLCQVYVQNESTEPEVLVRPWRWLRHTNQVEIPDIRAYYDGKTIRMVYIAVHPQLSTDDATLDPTRKEDLAIEAVLFWAAVQCWRAKERQNIAEIDLRDYFRLIQQDDALHNRLLLQCAMAKISILNY